ncbi:MAG TPA: YfiR family protein, partial [Gemmatimonadales bacterium]|nr:YfiR family protein [Gemmatimonadales bacterium]
MRQRTAVWHAVRRGRPPFLALLAVLGLAGRAAGQSMPAPVAIQVPLFAKILSFDRALAERASAPVVVGILFQGRFRTSARVADEVRELWTDGGRAGSTIRLVPIDLDEVDDIGAALARAGVHVLYIAPLRAANVGQVVAAAGRQRVTTVTGVPAYVEAGAAVGIDVRAERPRILINLPAARMAGAQ